MILTIREFPDEVRWKLRRKAMDSGVTLRELVIGGLTQLVGGQGGGSKQKMSEVGARIKGQMERLSKPAKSEEPEDELKF